MNFDSSPLITGSILVGAVLFTVWGGLLCIVRGSYTGRRYDVTRSETWLAMIPSGIVKWFSHPIPTAESPDNPNLRRLSARHSANLRTASKANDVLFVVPWTLALLVALCGICQCALVLIPSLTSNTRLADIYLSFGIAFLSFVPMVATHEVRDSRWRARAPFEWQFTAAALWLLDASNQSRARSQNAAGKLNLYSLWQVEATMMDRFGPSNRSTAPSRKLAQESWHNNLRPLFQDAALLHLYPHGAVGQQPIHEWIDRAATLIVEAGSRSRKRLFATRTDSPAASPLALSQSRHHRPSSAKAVILAVLLFSAGSLLLSWLSEIILNPQSLRDLITLTRQNPAAAMGIIVPTLAMLATVCQAVVSYASLLRLKRHA